MTRRSGMTLVEVLVAIFIMAIGLIALLTLFPIGILRIAQAIRDERTAQAGLNAQSIFIAQNIGNDSALVVNGGVDYFANPFPGTLPDALPYVESYSILVDPIGFNGAPAGSAQDWVGGAPGYLRRRSTSLAIGSSLYRYSNFTLWDDISFDGVLIPGTPQMSGPTVLRDTRFSWAYLLRRPQTYDRSIVDCTVVVFDQRSLAPTPGSLTLEEYVYTNTAFNPSTNSITINYTANVPPPLRAGDWILDATLNSASTLPCSAHSNFYRVVATEELGGNTARYEVQSPIRGFTGPMPPAGYQGTAIVIRGIAEVFDKGPVRMP